MSPKIHVGKIKLMDTCMCEMNNVECYALMTTEGGLSHLHRTG